MRRQGFNSLQKTSQGTRFSVNMFISTDKNHLNPQTHTHTFVQIQSTKFHLDGISRPVVIVENPNQTFFAVAVNQNHIFVKQTS